MEHVHPEDAAEQLRNIFRALKPGARYVCITPNRVSGPHDVSRYFEPLAKGFHLKEYSWGELSDLFRTVGFSRLEAYVGISKRYFRLPPGLLRAFESVIAALPDGLRRRISNLRIVRNFLFITLAGMK
jgi:SAM-dependent methyltransferase